MEYLERLVEVKEKIRGVVLPCSLDEISEFEKKIRKKLPKAYKEFLLLMGNSSGELFIGSDTRFTDLDELGEEAKSIVNRSMYKPLDQDVFVFFVHQNYSFYYFKLNTGDNPKVFLYVDGDDGVENEVQFESFVDFIEFFLDLYLREKCSLHY